MLCVLFSFWHLLILVASVNLTGHSWLHAYGHRATVEEWWDWVSVFLKASLSTRLAIDYFVMYLIHDVLIIPLSSSITHPPSILLPYLPISLPNHSYDRVYRNTFFSYFSSTFLLIFFYFYFYYFLTITYSHLVLTLYLSHRNYFYMLSAAFSWEMWSGVLKIPITDSVLWRGTWTLLEYKMCNRIYLCIIWLYWIFGYLYLPSSFVAFSILPNSSFSTNNNLMYFVLSCPDLIWPTLSCPVLPSFCLYFHRDGRLCIVRKEHIRAFAEPEDSIPPSSAQALLELVSQATVWEDESISGEN